MTAPTLHDDEEQGALPVSHANCIRLDVDVDQGHDQGQEDCLRRSHQAKKENSMRFRHDDDSECHCLSIFLHEWHLAAHGKVWQLLPAVLDMGNMTAVRHKRVPVAAACR